MKKIIKIEENEIVTIEENQIVITKENTTTENSDVVLYGTPGNLESENVYKLPQGVSNV